MCTFWSKKRPVTTNSADEALGNKFQQVRALEKEAVKEDFAAYTILLTQMTDSLHLSMAKYKGAIYIPLLEEIRNLAIECIKKRTLTDRRDNDVQLYNDLLAVNNVLANPSVESIKFLNARAQSSWFSSRVETNNTIAKAIIGIGIALFVLALIISFPLVTFSTFVGLGFIIEGAGMLGGSAIMFSGLPLFTPESNTGLLQIEYNMHEFAQQYPPLAVASAPVPSLA